MACYSLRKLLFTFQSTPSVGRATQYEENSAAYWLISIHALRGEGDHFHNCFGGTFACISIHALRGEGDKITGAYFIYRQYFNPRPPWGGRLCTPSLLSLWQ